MASDPLELLIDRLPTPIGEMIVVTDAHGKLRAIDWTDHEARLRQLLDRQYGKNRYELRPARAPAQLLDALRRYFAGDVAAIDKLPVRTAGTTFQKRVWKALRKIKRGSTISYSELARRVGNPNAVRAVGLANGQNPVGVVVPCHRVIGADGSLTGYGGGLPRKRWLLQHEGATFRA